MKTMLRIGLGLALSCGVAAGAQAQTIANPSFETDVVTTGPFDTRTGSQLTGWTVDGSIDLVRSYWQPQSGAQSIDLNGNGMGAISQTVTGLTSGVTYLVSFYVSGNPDNGKTPNPKTATLTLGGGSNAVSYTLTAANTNSAMQWEQRTYAFVAVGTSALIRLASNQDNAYGLAVDNFSITAAPEPATWAMMILGFGAAGVALRRRRRVSTAGTLASA